MLFASPSTTADHAELAVCLNYCIAAGKDLSTKEICIHNNIIHHARLYFAIKIIIIGWIYVFIRNFPGWPRIQSRFLVG